MLRRTNREKGIPIKIAKTLPRCDPYESFFIDSGISDFVTGESLATGKMKKVINPFLCQPPR
ncbi:hypothetical protein D3C80_709160 [compost metagenome]